MGALNDMSSQLGKGVGKVERKINQAVDGASAHPQLVSFHPPLAGYDLPFSLSLRYRFIAGRPSLSPLPCSGVGRWWSGWGTIRFARDGFRRKVIGAQYADSGWQLTEHAIDIIEI